MLIPDRNLIFMNLLAVSSYMIALFTFATLFPRFYGYTHNCTYCHRFIL
jgi:hypothetical protein